MGIFKMNKSDYGFLLHLYNIEDEAEADSVLDQRVILNLVWIKK